MATSQEDLQALWMWDTISRDQAVKLLGRESEGTYLVRPGSKPNSWSISVGMNTLYIMTRFPCVF